MKPIFFLLFLGLASSKGLSGAPDVFLPKVDQGPWDTLLKEFVNSQHLVDYARLKRNGEARLQDYIAGLGVPGDRPLSPNEKKAFLINAYNALTIRWVLESYPIQSIWNTSAPFTEIRHSLASKLVSLDGIESQLRAMRDPRIHSALVCAARSCPPLRREAYVAERVDEQLDDNTREWLANPSLNRFKPSLRKAEVSPILKWYRQDFDAYPGGLEGFLAKYAPPKVVELAGDKQFEIGFLNYDWGLNDQSDLGKNYSKLQYALDWVRNWFSSLRSH